MKELNLQDLIKIADEIDATLFGKKSNEVLFKHLHEEVEEFNAELNSEAETETQKKLEQLKEFGDVLFCIISIARQNDLSITHALSLTITKLQERIKFNINE